MVYWGGLHTVDGAGASKGLSSTDGLGEVSGVGLVGGLVRPVDGGAEGRTVGTGAGDIGVVVDRVTSLDNQDRDRRVLRQAVGHNQTRGASSDDDVVVGGRGHGAEGEEGKGEQHRCDCLALGSKE